MSPAFHALRAAAIAAFLTSLPLHAQRQAWQHPDGTTHWYEAVWAPQGITWGQAHRAAAEAGGHLATITSSGENDFVFGLLGRTELWLRDATSGEWSGAWIGAVQSPGGEEPGGGWTWAEIEPFAYRPWSPGKPNNAADADRAHFGGARDARVRTWSDANAGKKLSSYVVEYSGARAPLTVGLRKRTSSSFDGFTLINPNNAMTAYLVDARGRRVHEWQSQYRPGLSVDLLANGNLLRCGRVNNAFAGGRGGIIEEFDWDGKLVWQYRLATEQEQLHHDIARLPNGNTLAIVWFVKTRAEAIAAGRDPNLLADGELWPDKIIEVDKAGKVVWEWNVWDHLIQDHDPTKANYGNVAAHPELADINFGSAGDDADWLHSNAIDYNAKLDQIMLSVRHFDEIWIIDHSTTTKEAAGHTGGRSGKGGDILYRWGNPRAYRAGSAQDQQLFQQHDSQWIPDGLPGAGNILIYNNGLGRPGGDASSVDELVPPPIDQRGNYQRLGQTFLPKAPAWSYFGNPRADFYSRLVSGAQRLPNGNTLICEGLEGRSFEVTRDHEIVWEYHNPIIVRGIEFGVAARQGEQLAARANLVFRTPRYAADYPGLRGRDLTPGTPLEVYGTKLLAAGTAIDQEQRIGTGLALSIRSPNDGGRYYLAATSATRGVTPIGTRHVRFGLDDLAIASLSGHLQSVFRGYFGKLDAGGGADASIALPNTPSLVGLELRTAFFVLEPSAPSAVITISNVVTTRVVR